MASLKRWLDRRRNPWKGIAFDSFRRFRKDKAAARLRDFFDLEPGSVALDFGGFEGDWTDAVLAAQPEARVHVFEPHPRYAAALREKYKDRPGVCVHDFALGRFAGTLSLSDAGNASSAVDDHTRSFTAPVVAVRDFFAEQKIGKVQVAKINIEGGEYDLLPALIEAGLIGQIARLMVQFHLFKPEYQSARGAILKRLSLTHDPAWSYPFIWEEWRIKA
ncbi:FkbM family methyltransferase [Antarcticimicrobium sediminis]|uniref:FkbM family methyltransferase n=1 Tax=Antarcticimicrobium sediminis TaxID=2546227 RepID=A0A4V2Z8L6_9RHOB|nr:FkbM family methyltransferase [Antarcticimicrobium sediminis]TDE40696.1 FkbM family methyltransferase [Antarcticimicrobium sediminis]